jgi:hypothetical protein
MHPLIDMTQRIVSGKLIGGIGKGGVTSRISLFRLIPLNKKQKVNNDQHVNIQTHPLIWRRK